MKEYLRPRDRFLAAMMRQPVDRVPLFDFLFQQPLFTEIIGRTPGGYNARDAMDLTRALGLDAVWIPFGCFSGWIPQRLGGGVYKDEWGTTFQQTTSSWPIDAPIAFPLATRDELAGYVPPDALAEGRLDEISAAIQLNRDLGNEAVAILGGVSGPLTVSWMLMGYEAICLSLYEDQGFLVDVARLAVDFSIAATTRMVKAGVEAIIVSEDLGSSSQGLILPQHFRAIYKPALSDIVSHIKSLGLPVLLHSCGHIHEYLDDLAELDIDALHPLQRTAGMDLATVKTGYGHRFCLVGNIDSSRTLPYGTPDDVEREVREAISIAAPGWGYILGSDHSLHDGIPVANILRMFKAARTHGVYS